MGYAAAWLVGIGFGLSFSLTGGWREGAQWERDMLGWLHAPLPYWLDQVMIASVYVGTNLTVLPAVLVIGLVLWRRFHRPLIAAQLLAVCVGPLSLNAAMKHVLDRPRPALFPLRGMFAWASYPSGHLILTTALYFTIAGLLYRDRRWRWPFLVAPLIVLLTAYSRLYLAVHWPTDVIGGVLIGITWLFVTWRAFDRFRERSRPTSAT